MIDTLFIMIFIISDSLTLENRLDTEFNKSNKAFSIEKMKRASKEAANEALIKTHKELINILGIKEDSENSVEG